MSSTTYTPAVKRAADAIRALTRDLTTSELVALRDALAGPWDVLPPDIGDRAPVGPRFPTQPPLAEEAS